MCDLYISKRFSRPAASTDEQVETANGGRRRHQVDKRRTTNDADAASLGRKSWIISGSVAAMDSPENEPRSVPKSSVAWTVPKLTCWEQGNPYQKMSSRKFLTALADDQEATSKHWTHMSGGNNKLPLVRSDRRGRSR